MHIDGIRVTDQIEVKQMTKRSKILRTKIEREREQKKQRETNVVLMIHWKSSYFSTDKYDEENKWLTIYYKITVIHTPMAISLFLVPSTNLTSRARAQEGERMREKLYRHVVLD